MKGIIKQYAILYHIRKISGENSIHVQENIHFCFNSLIDFASYNEGRHVYAQINRKRERDGEKETGKTCEANGHVQEQELQHGG